MSDAQTTTPNDLLIETIAALLMKVGGYKDAAEAVLNATDMIRSIASSDGDEAMIGLMDFQTLVVQSAGATNFITQSIQDDADQSVRFVSEEGATPRPAAEVSVTEATVSDPLAELRNTIAEAIGIDPDNLVLLPAGQRFGGAGFPLN